MEWQEWKDSRGGGARNKGVDGKTRSARFSPRIIAAGAQTPALVDGTAIKMHAPRPPGLQGRRQRRKHIRRESADGLGGGDGTLTAAQIARVVAFERHCLCWWGWKAGLCICQTESAAATAANRHHFWFFARKRQDEAHCKYYSGPVMWEIERLAQQYTRLQNGNWKIFSSSLCWTLAGAFLRCCCRVQLAHELVPHFSTGYYYIYMARRIKCICMNLNALREGWKNAPFSLLLSSPSTCDARTQTTLTNWVWRAAQLLGSALFIFQTQRAVWSLQDFGQNAVGRKKAFSKVSIWQNFAMDTKQLQI